MLYDSLSSSLDICSLSCSGLGRRQTSADCSACSFPLGYFLSPAYWPRKQCCPVQHKNAGKFCQNSVVCLASFHLLFFLSATQLLLIIFMLVQICSISQSFPVFLSDAHSDHASSVFIKKLLQSHYFVINWLHFVHRVLCVLSIYSRFNH